MEHPNPVNPGKHDASSPLEQLYRKLRKLEELPIGTFLVDVDIQKEIAEPLRQEIISGHAYDAETDKVVTELRHTAESQTRRLAYAHTLIDGYTKAVVELRREKRTLMVAALAGVIATLLLTAWGLK